MTQPPKVVPLKTSVLLATLLWVMWCTPYAAFGEKLVRIPIASLPLRLLATASYAAVLGLAAGWLDWRWNRKPYYSQIKGRWLNQTGYMFVVAGIAGGLLAGALGWMLLVEKGYEGAFGGAIAGGVLGVVLGIVYRVVVFLFGLAKPWNSAAVST